MKGCGKSAPRTRQRGRHGKPHREQDRIGAARPPSPQRDGRGSSAFPRRRSGWSREASGQPASQTNGHRLPFGAGYRTRLTGHLALFPHHCPFHPSSGGRPGHMIPCAPMAAPFCPPAAQSDGPAWDGMGDFPRHPQDGRHPSSPRTPQFAGLSRGHPQDVHGPIHIFPRLIHSRWITVGRFPMLSHAGPPFPTQGPMPSEGVDSTGQQTMERSHFLKILEHSRNLCG